MTMVLVAIKTSFTNIQNISSKINLDQEEHLPIYLFKDFQCSIQQCQDSKGDMACLVFIFCYFTEQAIGFKAQNLKASINEVIPTKQNH